MFKHGLFVSQMNPKRTSTRTIASRTQLAWFVLQQYIQLSDPP